MLCNFVNCKNHICKSGLLYQQIAVLSSFIHDIGRYQLFLKKIITNNIMGTSVNDITKLKRKTPFLNTESLRSNKF